eukprot:7890505-Alexandrium_andersonii.AAC.1
MVATRLRLPEAVPLGLSRQIQSRVSVGPHAEVDAVVLSAALAVERVAPALTPPSPCPRVAQRV